MQNWHEYTEQVRGACSIEEVAASYGAKLSKVGRNRMSCCSPLRVDKNPSFMIYTDQQSWFDFGTRQHGDVFDLVQIREGCNFAAAVKMLGEKSGIRWNGHGAGVEGDPEFAAEVVKATERRFVEKIATDAAEYYYAQLTDAAREHLKKHYGFDDDIIERQRIGWADGSLITHLRERLGYPTKDILKTGLFIQTQGGRLIEHHEARITFPYPREGKLPYMISRRLDGVTPDNQYQAAKYKKTLVKSDNHSYVSRHVRNDIFYGQDSAKKKCDYLIHTEGVTDAISLMMCGWPVISPVTTRYKASEIDRSVQLSGNAKISVIINDHERPRLDSRTGRMIQPGLDGAAETAKALFAAGRDVRIGILPLPEGADKIDVNEFVRDSGPKALEKVIHEALPYPEFLIWRVPVDTRPAELDEALSPAYEAIAKCPAVEREAYINSICRRFSLTRETVADAVAEFLKAKGPAPLLPAAKESTPPPTPPTKQGGDEPPPSGGSANLSNIHGVVYEHPDGYYYRVERTREGEYLEVRISNFVLIPKALIHIDGAPHRICCDIRSVRGKVVREAIFREKTFASLLNFKTEMQRHMPDANWSGKDINVAGVLEIISEASPQIKHGVTSLGYVETPERDENGIKRMVPKWVGPDYVITKDGISKRQDIVFAGDQPAPVASAIDYRGAELSNDEIRDLAQRVIPKIFALNRPEVILPTLGWFYATPVTPVIRDVLGHMPSLYCWGSQGSGKSTYIREVFWPMLGVYKEPFSCASTKFSMLSNLSSVTSIVLVYDEYKHDLPIQNQQFVQRFLRSTYIGETEMRGRSDLSIMPYRLVAPLCIIGEMMPTDPALLERVIPVSPMKPTLTTESRKIIAQLSGEKLQLLAGHYIRFILGRDIRADIATAKAIMQSKMLPLLREPLPPRLIDNLLVVVLGDYLHRKWCDEIGVVIKNRPTLESVFPILVANITDSEGGGGVKDACDRFLGALSTYAHLGILKEGIHYAMVGGLICIHLDSCYAVYLKERRQANLPDETNGMQSLRRIMRENCDTDGYVVNMSQRVTFCDDRGNKHQARSVAIDFRKVPEHLNIDNFPAGENRRQGGGGNFGGWN